MTARWFSASREAKGGNAASLGVPRSLVPAGFPRARGRQSPKVVFDNGCS
jgi:hypothetical protein